MGEDGHLGHQCHLELVEKRMEKIVGAHFIRHFYRCKCGATKLRLSRI